MPAPSSGRRTIDAIDVCRREAVLASKRQQRVERRLNRIPDRERLDRGFRHVEPAAETGGHLLGSRLRRMRLEPVVLAFEHVGNAAESGLRHHRRGHAVARAHAGKVERFLDVLEVALPAPHARDLLDGVRQGVPHALLIEARHRRGGRGGAHRGAHAFGAAMRRAHVIGTERHAASGSTGRTRARRRE